MTPTIKRGTLQVVKDGNGYYLYGIAASGKTVRIAFIGPTFIGDASLYSDATWAATYNFYLCD